MSDWIFLDEYYTHLQEELEARRKREDLLNEYFGTWDDDVSNRKKIKGAAKLEVKGSRLRDRIEKIQNSFAGRYNAYLCGTCDSGYVTLDVDPGVTPMFGPCFATQGCDGVARSAGYPDGDPPEDLGRPIVHWVRPTEEELKSLSPSLQQHVAQGGLIRRPTEFTPDWVKELL